MSFTVAVRSARSASSSHVVSVRLQRGGTVADLKRALCEPPCSMFSGPSSVALVLRRSVLQDDADLQLLCAADHACVTALQLLAPSCACPVSTNSASLAAATISRGARVQIHGLRQKPELNGRFGVVFCSVREGEKRASLSKCGCGPLTSHLHPQEQPRTLLILIGSTRSVFPSPAFWSSSSAMEGGQLSPG